MDTNTHITPKADAASNALNTRQRLLYAGNTKAYESALYEAARHIACDPYSGRGLNAEFFAKLERVQAQMKQSDQEAVNAILSFDDSAPTNALGETNGRFINGQWTVLPRWGLYFYGDKPTEWISNDEAVVERECERINAEGRFNCCLEDGLPSIWYCRSCGRRHRNGTSDYCSPCNRGE